jgi:hypothetical protein
MNNAFICFVHHCLKRVSHFATARVSNYPSWVFFFAQLSDSKLEVAEFVFRHKAGLLYGRSIDHKPLSLQNSTE